MNCPGFIFALSALATVSSAQEAQVSETTRDHLIALVETREAGLETLELEVSCHVDRGPKDSPEPSGDVIIKVRRTGRPSGRIRVELCPQIWPHENGSMIESWNTATYDGEFSYFLDQRYGSTKPDGSYTSHTRSSGEVREGRKLALALNSLYTGWRATIYGNYEEKGLRLSEVLASIGSDLEVSRTASRLIAVARAQRKTRRWYFTEEGGFDLVRYEEQVGSVMVRETAVHGFLDAGSGVRFPESVTDTLRFDNGVRRATHQINCKRAVANAPGFDQTLFVLDFPVGTSVLDRVTGERVKIGPGQSELKSLITGQLEQAREAKSSPPSQQSSMWSWVLIALGCLTVFTAFLARPRSQRGKLQTTDTMKPRRKVSSKSSSVSALVLASLLICDEPTAQHSRGVRSTSCIFRTGCLYASPR